MKKGFTLIEILGVIIILSVLSTVAVVGVDKSIKKGRVTTCEAQEENIMEAAKMYLTDNPKANTRMITIGQLRNGGYLDKDFVNPMTGEKYKDDTYVNKGKNTIVYQNEPSCTGEESVITEPIIKLWKSNSKDDFRSDDYRPHITSVIFENQINIPGGAKSWDVSAKEGSKLVMAWVTAAPEDSSKYILHIAGDGGVVANTDSSYMFYDFPNLKSIDFGNNFDTGMVTNMSSMFANCDNLTSLDVSSFDTSSVTNMSHMFEGKYVAQQDAGYNRWYKGLYYGSLKNLDLSNFDTSNVVDMSYMFAYQNELTEININNFDTSSVTNMSHMFDGCASLTNINISKWNTHNVTNMSYMFAGMETSYSNTFTLDVWYKGSLKKLDLSNFDTSNVVDMSYMFAYQAALEDLNISSFNTSKVTNMSYMFSGLGAMTTLDISNFNTPSLEKTEMMFGVIYTGRWPSYYVINDYYNDIKKALPLSTIYVSNNWNVSNVTASNYMFMGCTNLPNYDSTKLEKDKANYSSDGYLKLKS